MYINVQYPRQIHLAYSTICLECVQIEYYWGSLQDVNVNSKGYNELENNLKQETEKGDALREYVKKLERENETIQCEHCDFTTTSKKGFKTHVKKKHSETKKENFPTSCEVCDLKVTSKVELKRHMVSHTINF